MNLKGLRYSLNHKGIIKIHGKCLEAGLDTVCNKSLNNQIRKQPVSTQLSMCPSVQETNNQSNGKIRIYLLRTQKSINNSKTLKLKSQSFKYKKRNSPFLNRLIIDSSKLHLTKDSNFKTCKIQKSNIIKTKILKLATYDAVDVTRIIRAGTHGQRLYLRATR